MQINLTWSPSLSSCPSCTHEQDFSATAECRECGYHAGGDMSQEWLDFCSHLEADMGRPKWIEIEFCHEAEGSTETDYWIEISLNRRAEDFDEAALRNWIAKLGGAVEEGEMQAALAGCSNRMEIATLQDIETAIEEIAETQVAELTEVRHVEADADQAMAHAAYNAIEHGKQVWIGQDDDGYYFRIVEPGRSVKCPSCGRELEEGFWQRFKPECLPKLVTEFLPFSPRLFACMECPVR